MLACHLYLTGMAWHGMACFGLTGGVPWHAGMFWVDGEWHGMAWHVLG